MALVLGCRQHVIKQAYKGFIIMVTVLECKTTCLLDLPSVLDHHETPSFDVRVPKVVRVSALYLSTVAVASSTNPSKYTPLGCKNSAQQGLSMAIASYMIEFPARECEHVSISQLD